jgi:hypothetical protein
MSSSKRNSAKSSAAAARLAAARAAAEAAAAEAEAAGGSEIAEVLAERGFGEGLDTLPLYFISTHGAYDMRDPEGGAWSEEDELFEVPDGVHIFETMQMGDLCLTTIDQYLWTMSQGTKRDVFLRFFLTGEGAEDFGFIENTKSGPRVVSAAKANEIAQQVFQQLYYYGPGTRIARRTLAIGGGKRNEVAGQGQETLRRDYVNMGFYKFPVGAGENAYPDVPRRGLPASRIPGLTPLRNEMVETDRTVNSNEMIDLVKEAEGVDGGVFLFTSCAQIWHDDEVSARENKRRVAILERIQAEATQIMAEKDIPFRPGGPGANVSRGWWSERRALEHRMKAILAAQGAASGKAGVSRRGAPEVFAEEEGVNEDLVFANSDEANENMNNVGAPTTSARAPPAGTAAYYKVIFTATKPRQVRRMIPIIGDTNSPYLSIQGLRLALRHTPLDEGEVLYRLDGTKGTGKAKRALWQRITVSDGHPAASAENCAGGSCATRRRGGKSRLGRRYTYKRS